MVRDGYLCLHGLTVPGPHLADPVPASTVSVSLYVSGLLSSADTVLLMSSTPSDLSFYFSLPTE